MIKIKQRNLKVIAIVLALIGIASVFQNQLKVKIDGSTLLVFMCSLILFLIDDVSALKKIKLGDVEVELNQEINHLEHLVESNEKEQLVNGRRVVANEATDVSTKRSEFYNDYQRILNSNASDLEKVLRASQLMERLLIHAGEELGVEDTRSPLVIVQTLHKEGLMTDEQMQIYNEYRAIRNKVIHKDVTLDDQTTVRLLDLLWRMITVFY